MALLLTAAAGAASAWCWSAHVALRRDHHAAALARLARTAGLAATALFAAFAAWLLAAPLQQATASAPLWLLATAGSAAALAFVLGFALPHAWARWRRLPPGKVRGPLAWAAQRLGQAGAAGEQAPVDERVAANVRGLGDLQLSALMVERTAIEAIGEGATLEQARARFLASGHSRLLVYRDTLDHVTGVAYAYDLFHEPASLADVTRPAFFVRLDMPVDALLREMITRHHSLAVVMDDFGGTAGLVAREDLLEALFGDIQDEFDAADVLARRAGPDTVIALGRADVQTLRAQFGVRLPEGEFETVAGFLLDRMGRVPATGEAFEDAGYRFFVLDATASRVDSVRITRAT